MTSSLIIKVNIHRDMFGGALIIETTLSLMINLWYLQDKEVHGKTANEKEQKRKNRLLKNID